MAKTAEVAESLARYINEKKPGTVVALLEPRQLSMLSDTRDSLDRGESKITREAATGVGKTLEQMAILDAIFPDEPLKEANLPRVLVAEPTIHALHQAADDYVLFIPRVPVGKYYGGEKDLTQPVTITTYASLVNMQRKGLITPGEYDFVFYDEAHHLLGETRKESVGVFNGAVQIGYTATPAYGVNKDLRELLPEARSRISIREGAENNLLSSYSNYIVRTGIDISHVETVQTNQGKDFNSTQLGNAVNVAERTSLAVELYKRNHDGELAVCTCVTVAHAKDTSDLFNTNNIPAADINGKMSDKVQREIIEAWKNGELKVVTYRDILNESLNIIDLSVEFNLRPTLSIVLARQRAGRVLRLNRINPSKYAHIYDFIDVFGSSSRLPIVFAQVAEAAAIVNTWYSSYGGAEYDQSRQKPQLQYHPPGVITDPEEVMWAVNNQYRRPGEVSIDLPEWKTLRRISAEIGIPVWGLENLIKKYGEQFLSAEDIKAFESPQGNNIDHYNIDAFYKMLQYALDIEDIGKLLKKRESRKSIIKDLYIDHVVDKDLRFIDQEFAIKEGTFVPFKVEQTSYYREDQAYERAEHQRSETRWFKYDMSTTNWLRLIGRIGQLMEQEGINLQVDTSIGDNNVVRTGNQVRYNFDRNGVITAHKFIAEYAKQSLGMGARDLSRNPIEAAQFEVVNFLLREYFGRSTHHISPRELIDSLSSKEISREQLYQQSADIKRTVIEVIKKIDPSNLRYHVPEIPEVPKKPDAQERRMDDYTAMRDTVRNLVEWQVPLKLDTYSVY